MDRPPRLAKSQASEKVHEQYQVGRRASRKVKDEQQNDVDSAHAENDVVALAGGDDEATNTENHNANTQLTMTDQHNDASEITAGVSLRRSARLGSVANTQARSTEAQNNDTILPLTTTLAQLLGFRGSDTIRPAEQQQQQPSQINAAVPPNNSDYDSELSSARSDLSDPFSPPPISPLDLGPPAYPHLFQPTSFISQRPSRSATISAFSLPARSHDAGSPDSEAELSDEDQSRVFRSQLGSPIMFVQESTTGSPAEERQARAEGARSNSLGRARPGRPSSRGRSTSRRRGRGNNSGVRASSPLRNVQRAQDRYSPDYEEQHMGIGMSMGMGMGMGAVSARAQGPVMVPGASPFEPPHEQTGFTPPRKRAPERRLSFSDDPKDKQSATLEADKLAATKASEAAWKDAMMATFSRKPESSRAVTGHGEGPFRSSISAKERPETPQESRNTIASAVGGSDSTQSEVGISAVGPNAQPLQRPRQVEPIRCSSAAGVQGRPKSIALSLLNNEVYEAACEVDPEITAQGTRFNPALLNTAAMLETAEQRAVTTGVEVDREQMEELRRYSVAANVLNDNMKTANKAPAAAPRQLPSIRLNEFENLAIAHLKRVDTDAINYEDHCSFHNFVCDSGVSDSSVWLPREAFPEFCDNCQPQRVAYNSDFPGENWISNEDMNEYVDFSDDDDDAPQAYPREGDQVAESEIITGRRIFGSDAEKKENKNKPAPGVERVKDHNSSKDVTEFQAILTCRAHTYRQVDCRKAKICDPCLQEKVDIIKHKLHQKFVPVQNQPKVDMYGEVIPQDPRAKICMVCANLASDQCEGCPLRLCGSCEVFIRRIGKGSLNGLFYHYDHEQAV